MPGQYNSRAEVLKAIADLKARFPAHSLKPAMMQELEDLEELLEEFPETAAPQNESGETGTGKSG